LSGVADFVADAAVVEECAGEVFALNVVPHITLAPMAKLSTDFTAVPSLTSTNKLVKIFWSLRGKITT